MGRKSRLKAERREANIERVQRERDSVEIKRASTLWHDAIMHRWNDPQTDERYIKPNEMPVIIRPEGVIQIFDEMFYSEYTLLDDIDERIDDWIKTQANLRMPFNRMWIEWHDNDQDYGYLLSWIEDDWCIEILRFEADDDASYEEKYTRFGYTYNILRPNKTVVYLKEDFTVNDGTAYTNYFKLKRDEDEWIWCADALFVLTFLNMRNVELIDNVPNPRLSAIHEREYGRPLSTYKTLSIKPTRKEYQNSAEGESTATKQRLHIVRGHPRKVEAHPFIPDGTYWIPAHVRGDESLGVVVKDYKVRAN
jgi:hypothetical protein